MSRLDKQLDKISGEKLVRLHWPEDGSADIEMLRADLVREINSHEHRIPLDLRNVKGAPGELVQLIVDMERYARSKAKILSTNRVLPELRDAIDRHAGRRSGPTNRDELDVASKTAREILNGKEKEVEVQITKGGTEDPKPKPKPRVNKAKRKRDILILAGIVVGAGAIVIGLMAWYIFGLDSIVIETDKIYE